MKSSNLLGMSQAELVALAEALDEKPFRGRQLFHQIYCLRQYRFEAMTDLAKAFRRKLEANYAVALPETNRRSCSSDGTIKYLLRLEDGNFVETVFIPEEKRETLCISSQVGCAVGCTFCMTARMGFLRNLRPSEIIGQVLVAIGDGVVRERGFNIVFMGMGEPLHNFRNVMNAFRIMTDPDGMDLSHRKITVSTSGVVPVLAKLAEEPVLPNLAISLNATTNEVRNRIMPINRRWGMEELLEACRRFPLESRRRITFEYVLLAGENDTEQDALRLARLLRGIPSKINLIPYNPGPGLSHLRPTESAVARFRELLSDRQIASFIRKTRGADIAAACGQLACLDQGREREASLV